MSTKLYTKADLVEILSSTTQKVHDWSQRSKEFYVEPDFVAGRANQKGTCLIKLWSEGQLEEIEEKYTEYEKKKAKYHQKRESKQDSLVGYQKKRAEDQRRYKAKYREKKKAEAEAEAQAFIDEFEEERRNAAMAFLIEKGLV
jgi:hypothetical protein